MEIYDKTTCLAAEVLSRPLDECPGPEFTASQTIGKSACHMCIVPCVDKLIADKRAEETAKNLAMIDSTTGLPNRQVFDDNFDRMVRRGEPFGLMMVDIDNMKSVNDKKGHLRGDDLLRLLSSSILENLRPLDRMFRIGGDEFAVLLENPYISTQQSLDCFALRFENIFCSAVEDKEDKFPKDLKIGASVAVGLYHGGDGAQFYDSVDSAMMNRKRARREERGVVVDIDSRLIDLGDNQKQSYQ